jgi:excisionase family DNA binding protein
MDRLISIEKAAEVLGVSPWTIRAWITQGKLGSAKLGSRRLVPESEIQKLIADARVPALFGLRNATKVPAEAVKR